MSEEEKNIFLRTSNEIDWLSYNTQNTEEQIAKEKIEKYLEFKNRINKFNNIQTLVEAKNLSQQIMPVAQELSQFRVGDALCVIVNKPNMFRISLDSETEFISYDFV